MDNRTNQQGLINVRQTSELPEIHSQHFDILKIQGDIHVNVV